MKTLKKVMALAMAMTTVGSAASLVGCGLFGEDGEQVDKNRTQLQIAVREGGAGTKWYEEMEKAFEEMYKDIPFEKGKKGVQLMETWGKEEFSTNNIYNDLKSGSDSYDVYVSYVTYKNIVNDGLALDITDVVKGKADDSETMTIEQKMNAQYKDYFASSYLGENSKHYGKYYGLPTNDNVLGLHYDMDLFDEYEWYFYGEGLGTFQDSSAGAKSAGPDGKLGNSDDGLPATFEQFKQLVRAIVAENNNIIPFTWNSAGGYLEEFLMSVLAADAGYEAFMANINFEGTIKLADGSDVEINEENGWMLTKQANKKYVTEVAQFMVSDSRFYSDKAFDTNQTHIKAQQEYVWSCAPDANNRIAMILEGSWWENEADSIGAFDTLVDEWKDESYSRENRKFGYMPFPKRDGNAAGQVGNTLFSSNDGGAIFANAKVKGTPQEELAKLFIKYFASDEALSNYAGTTGLIRPYEYEIETEDYNRMSAYAKNVYDIYHDEDATITHQTLTNCYMKSQEGSYLYDLYRMGSKVNNIEYTNLISAFKHNTFLTPQSVFDGFANMYSENDWKKKLSAYFGD